MSQQHRSAIVTGASRGIGAAISRRLAKDGIAVAINYASGKAEADAVVQSIEAAGGRAIAVQADLTKPDAVRALFDKAEESLGGIDILVNNAGIMPLSPIAEATDEAFERIIAVNLRAVFHGLREASIRLRSGGRIINFSSSVVGLYQPGYGLYAATKAAIEAMTRIVAKELGPKKITVNAIAPGPVGTALFFEGKSQPQIEAIAKLNPFGRLGEPDDIAGVASFLAGPDSQWINGQVLRANGGVI